MKIAILDAGTFNFDNLGPWEPLHQFGEVEIFERVPYEVDAIVNKCQGYDIVLTNKVPINAETIAQLPNLKMISVLATGHNIVDGSAARERNIPVCNAPNYSTQSVAQHTLALILELCNNVGLHSQSVHEGDWTRSEHFTYWKKPHIELTGATVGFIGWGEIGQRVGELVRALGANVLAYSRSRRNTPDWPNGFRWGDLGEVFAESDVLTLHCPQTSENLGFVNRERLISMKKTAFLVNTARGTLVDESALLDALQTGQIAGAALDVISKEPMTKDNPLLGAPNCYITPHVAWSSLPARRHLLEITFANIQAYLNGSPQNVVN
ncbi:D-2-hydroxyacid dehydrogenase [Cerasicoccus arenae]|nr:D-2-hydroxyacid dehydrogenase [Cerasicoccus arenae]MBK1857829.1 D-2-hydroxyacid dehydrogenase [Cerasicoccus arenae]